MPNLGSLQHMFSWGCWVFCSDSSRSNKNNNQTQPTEVYPETWILYSMIQYNHQHWQSHSQNMGMLWTSGIISKHGIIRFEPKLTYAWQPFSKLHHSKIQEALKEQNRSSQDKKQLEIRATLDFTCIEALQSYDLNQITWAVAKIYWKNPYALVGQWDSQRMDCDNLNKTINQVGSWNYSYVWINYTKVAETKPFCDTCFLAIAILAVLAIIHWCPHEYHHCWCLNPQKRC
jgi:hypothetical protein